MKPILFNTQMVRAILEGRKTVTRRLIKPRYRDDESGFQVVTDLHTGEFVRVEKTSDQGSGLFPDGSERYVRPPYRPGDILYVRETWSFWPCWDCDIDCNNRKVIYNGESGCFVYKTQKNKVPHNERWHPSIHMPKEAARIFLRVTAVRAERLQDITNDPPGPRNQVVREGFKYGCDFVAVWQNTIKKEDLPTYGWEANPWVWVIEFELYENGRRGRYAQM